jgi:hypothetical protein
MLVNKEPKDENSGISAKYYIENEKGTFFAWGSTVLDDRMQYVKVGQKIRITYEGKTKNKRGQDVNLFKVEVSNIKSESGQRADPATLSKGDSPIPIESIEGVSR